MTPAQAKQVRDLPIVPRGGAGPGRTRSCANLAYAEHLLAECKAASVPVVARVHPRVHRALDQLVGGGPVGWIDERYAGSWIPVSSQIGRRLRSSRCAGSRVRAPPSSSLSPTWEPPMVDLDRFRRDLASLRGLTADDAEQMCIQIQRAVRQADRAAARAVTRRQAEPAAR